MKTTLLSLAITALSLSACAKEVRYQTLKLGPDECIETILPPTGSGESVIVAVSDRQYNIRLVRAKTNSVSGRLCMATMD